MSETKAKEAEEVFYMSQTVDLPVTGAEIQRETRKDKVLAAVLNNTMNGWESSDNPFSIRTNYCL